MNDLQVIAAILAGFSAVVGALGTWTMKAFQAAVQEWRAVVADLRAENSSLRAENQQLRGQTRTGRSNEGSGS